MLFSMTKRSGSLREINNIKKTRKNLPISAAIIEATDRPATRILVPPSQVIVSEKN